MNTISLADIQAARSRLADKIDRTVTVPSAALSEIAGAPANASTPSMVIERGCVSVGASVVEPPAATVVTQS